MVVRIRETKPGKEGREEWLLWRRPNINASEAGALLGVDKYRSAFALYHEKFGNLVTEETEAMRRGRWLEPAVIEMIKETCPQWKVEARGKHYLDDPDINIGCTPDAYLTCRKTGKKGVLQCKTVGDRAFEQWQKNGGIQAPLGYQIQTMIEAKMSARMDFIVLGTLVVGYKVEGLPPFMIDFHEGIWRSLLKQTKLFFSNAKKGIEPSITEFDEEIVKAVYPLANGLTVDLRTDNELPEIIDKEECLANVISEHEKVIKPVKKEREGLRTLIKGKIGDAEIALLPNGKMATFKNIERRASVSRQLNIREMKD